jgi:hypothetical protein
MADSCGLRYETSDCADGCRSPEELLDDELVVFADSRRGE